MAKKLLQIHQGTVYTDVYDRHNDSKKLVHVWVTSGYFDNQNLLIDFYIPFKQEWISSPIAMSGMFDVIKLRLRHHGYEFANGHYGFSTGKYERRDEK
jgi:hypothetical protein